jgi:hypothetical protein
MGGPAGGLLQGFLGGGQNDGELDLPLLRRGAGLG